MASFQRNNNPQSGTLLLNVLLSLSIAMLMTTLSIPYFRQYQSNQKLDAATRNLAYDLRLAQQLTVSEQTVYYLTMSTSTRQYQIYRTGSSTPIKSEQLDTILSYDSIAGFSSSTIRFNAYGSVSQAGSIVLKNNTNLKRTINVKPSGYVEISK